MRNMLGITNVSNAPSVILKDTLVSPWYTLPSTGTDSDMKTQGYTYYGTIAVSGVTENTFVEVTFSDAQSKSENYAPICRTYADEIRIYSKVNTTITVPTITVHSIVETYYGAADMNPPTSGKTTAISSGSVYDNCIMRDPNLDDGYLLEWDGTNQKAIDSGINPREVITDSYQDVGYLPLPVGLSGAIRKCCIAPNVYLYTFIDVVSTSTGDITIDTLPASFSSCNARSPALLNPNTGAVTATVYILNGQSTVKLRVFTASSYIVGSFVVGY